VCASADPRDKRLRASALVDTGSERILIDCGPDFRQQLLPLPFEKIDGVLVTHEHYDHVGGLDDLRPFCKFAAVPIYAEDYVAEALRVRMPYCFTERHRPGVPDISLVEVAPDVPFRVGHTEVLPVRVMHGRLPILGFRVGERLGYVTDMLTMPDESYRQLAGVELLIINALRYEPHPTHQTVGEAIAAARRIGAKETYFIHASHHIGLHAELERRLPPHVHQAYDGEEIVLTSAGR
jgi:phosphoribosyl 1,2-cyclic phosphate phosphodiesterase